MVIACPYTILYGVYYPQVAIECLKYGYCNTETILNVTAFKVTEIVTVTSACATG